MNKNIFLKSLIIIFCFNFSLPAFSAPKPLAVSNAIYNGNVVTSDEEFPFVVGIYYKNDEGHYSAQASCTGTIIDKNWVLTAAHCVLSSNSDEPICSDPNDLLIGTGHLAKNQAKAEHLFYVKKIYVFNNDIQHYSQHDVALLQLAESTDIKPVFLPALSDDFSNLKKGNISATEIGFGWIDVMDVKYFSPIFDNYLHVGDEVVQDDQTIVSLLNKFTQLDPPDVDAPDDASYNPMTMLGVLSPDGKKATHDDSGGPLLISFSQPDHTNHEIQVGVASWEHFTSNTLQKGYFKDEPMIFANLTEPNILKFIYTTIQTAP